jgi:T-complex protein 1 subunit theta
MARHFCERAGLMVLKISSKFELRRLCRAVGATPQVALGPVSKEHQGFCSNVFVREVGLRKVTVFAQDDNSDNNVATIMLRASTGGVLADVEKAVDDGINTIKAMGKNLGETGAQFVAGAGATEIEMATRLYAIGAKSHGLDQYSIKKFAQAMEVVPRSLAVNCGQNPMDAVSNLYAAHEKGLATHGIDIEAHSAGGTVDASEKHIYDLLPTKLQAMKLAIDAAVTVLRVDQFIQAKPAGGPKVPGK